MIIEKTLYALDDVTIIPAVQSDIYHRNQCNVYDEEGFLPIFTAPMDAVIGKCNMTIFENKKIIPIMPRTETINDRIEWFKKGYWIALGVDEFEEYFLHIENFPVPDKNKHGHVLIDIANGHMSYLPEYVRKAKKLAKKYDEGFKIMVGNIAHPDTYKIFAEAGADYVRCSIGSGSCCITSSNTAAHYPMASLLDGCRKHKVENNFTCKIVADGGINNFARANKALALGADYVMMGSLLGSCFESAADIYGFRLQDCLAINMLDIHDETIAEDLKKDFICTYKPTKIIYGMSTKKAQQKINPNAKKLKTSEGIERTLDVHYTIAQWVDNFESYLKSVMSYTNYKDIKDFVGGPILMLMSESAKASINK